jgi:hypothetical protein
MFAVSWCSHPDLIGPSSSFFNVSCPVRLYLMCLSCFSPRAFEPWAKDNVWVQADVSDAVKAKYGFPFRDANVSHTIMVQNYDRD